MEVKVVSKQEVIVETDQWKLVITAEDNEAQFGITAYDKTLPEGLTLDGVDHPFGKFKVFEGVLKNLIFTGVRGGGLYLEPDVDKLASTEISSFKKPATLIRGIDIDAYVIKVETVTIYLKPKSYIGEGPADWFTLHIYENGNDRGLIDTRR